MERTYNPYYSYDDIGLWEMEAWEGRRAPMEPMARKVMELLRAENTPLEDCFPGRDDLVTGDSQQRMPYFPDVTAAWAEKGLKYVSGGMFGLSMVPLSVVRRENSAPRVLYIPVVASRDPKWAMNTLEKYRPVLEACAGEEILVQFIEQAASNPERGLETQGTFKITYAPVYYDVSALVRAGVDPRSFGDYEITTLAGLPVVDVTGTWQPGVAHQPTISQMYKRGQPEWDYVKHFHSAMGKRQAESFHLELDYDTPADPRMAAFWEKKGLCYEDHYYGYDWWVTLTPKSALEHPEKKLPLLLIMKEPRTAIPQMMQTAFQFYYDFLDIAAHGEFMVLYFALEHPDDNDILAEIVEEAKKLYPIDPARIYITGQSHNGYYALEFYRRHPTLIAAAATLADPIGLQVGATIDWYDKDPEGIVASFKAHDLPLININGQLENKFCTAPRGSELERKNAVYFQRRLEAFRCPPKTVEEIIAARDSDDYVTRVNGIPADRTELVYHYGMECYVSDLQNVDGRWHLRFVTVENTPHMIVPQMAEFAWSFLRRFARDGNGETVELYGRT